MTRDTNAPERVWLWPDANDHFNPAKPDWGSGHWDCDGGLQSEAYVRADLLTAAEARAEAAEAERDRLAALVEDAAQILSQCTWSTMRVNRQYVDREELVDSYRATLAKMEKTDEA